MKKNIFIVIIVAILFSSCQENKKNEKLNTDNLDSSKTETIKDTIIPKTDCVRGQATSLVKKDIYPDAIFKLNADSLTSNESFQLKNGDKVNIHNYGCEYYVLTFTIETTRFPNENYKNEFWYKAIADLMEEISVSVDAPVRLVEGILALRQYAESKTEGNQMELATPIYYGESDISFSVTIDKIDQLNKNIKSIEVTFAVGPL